MYFVLGYNLAKIAKTLYKTRINFRFLSYMFLSLGWSMKTKYLLYFENFLPKLRFE